MPIILRLTPHTRYGAYAYVFRTENGHAVKVFKRGNDDHVRNVCNSEVAAYQNASESDKLNRFVAHFVGDLAGTPIRIEDERGTDISARFALDCAYEMRWLDGKEYKIGNLPPEEQVRLKAYFHGSGIFHLTDFSVVKGDDGAILGFIDFAMQEYVQQHLTHC
jgi:hypothetical protein